MLSMTFVVLILFSNNHYDVKDHVLAKLSSINVEIVHEEHAMKTSHQGMEGETQIKIDKQLDSKNQERKKQHYLKCSTFPRNSCQEMSPSRNFMSRLEPLLGITIAMGEWASITLLQI